MLVRLRPRPSAIVTAIPWRRPRAISAPAITRLRAWPAYRWETIWIAAILTVAALAHAVNMFNFPYQETDEGTYTSYAWALLRLGQLSPYTYWYDHAPLGWLQIAVWNVLTGGFHTFGTAVDSGRILMLEFQVASTFLVYAIARSITRSVFASSIASLMFALSGYGILYHRRVLLDNIATFWMLASLLFLVVGRLRLTNVWLSALALGISALSKEVTLFVIPAFMGIVLIRADARLRRFAAAGWLAIVVAVFSSWILMALLKDEFFPPGIFLGGQSAHVSLIDSLQFQVARGKDGGLLDLNSRFWEKANAWSRQDPLLVVGGSAAALASLLLARRRPLVAAIGAVTLSLWFFLGRGGVVLWFYLLPLLPLLALNLALLASVVLERWQFPVPGRFPALIKQGLRRLAPIGGKALLVLVALRLVGMSYTTNELDLGRDPLTLWKSEQSMAQRDAIGWVMRNVSPANGMIIDNFMWTELHDPATPHAPYDRAHWYYKVDLDPAVGEGVFQSSWKNVDYVVATWEMKSDVAAENLSLVGDTLVHSSPIATFDTGGWPIEIRRVDKLQEWTASADPMLTRSWRSYIANFLEGGRVADPRINRETTSEAQSYALLQAVYMDDRATFERVWAWTKSNLQVRGDGLLAWRWGRRSDGTTGVLDASSATDAEEDTALALLFAARRWHQPALQEEARQIIRGIWDQETAVVNGHRVLVGGNWARGDQSGAQRRVVVNPSYFAPYAYRIFADVDPDHPWAQLVDSTFLLLDQIRRTPAFGGDVGLVPNWVMLDSETGALLAADSLGPTASEYSYDASRLPWRLAIDWIWFRDNRARQSLEALSFPRREIELNQRMVAAYRLDGTPAVDYESPTMYAGSLGALLLAPDQELAHRIYAQKILQRYVEDPQGAHWGDSNDYYEQNWAWFATALMNGGMSNLWASQTVIHWQEVFP